MKSLPIQERALRKRSLLLKAANTEFAEGGFELATAKSIAARAGVATGTFYQYFENKNDILRVIAELRCSQLHSQISLLDMQEVSALVQNPISPVEQVFADVLSFIYDFHAQDPELHQVLEQRRGIDPKLQQILQQGEAILQQTTLVFVQSFNLPDAKIVADNLFSMAEGLVHRHVFAGLTTDKDQVIEVGAKMLASYFDTSVSNRE